ncbi:MAG: aspartate kinase [Paludibacter sp.]|nr:aspartate kinase [Bacteroidales bacterium]MCM1068794.1 aspartate kinase [Prevotella sp.]MCM1353935.1 aspartate kinase [Bacteroides sp.]MCM1443333.1 aspartate kinase [Muribaculum sp.]MCM1482126.1 aspartate kinase [Paludibacter sp.]
MKVYKFGGASVKDAEGIRNLIRIVKAQSEPLVVVVSAMGKTTNALERVVNAAFEQRLQTALDELNGVRQYHYSVIDKLFPCGHVVLQNKVENLLQQVVCIIHDIMRERQQRNDNRFYDYSYDRIVSFGERISTAIVTYALNREGQPAVGLDMTVLLRTDDSWREAKVDMQSSERLLKEALQKHHAQVYVAQGFIGGTTDGDSTTLGREGSDYSAALIANLLDAQSVTIWKDVPGILNADPRLFASTTLIPELTYYDAVELSYSGAQIIHPKTIRPLENKHIPLYVKPFSQPEQPGSVIKDVTGQPINVPVFIWRKNQVLVTLRPNDFSFVLEDCLNNLFEVIYRYRLKVSLIQSSAVTISVCVDASRYLTEAFTELQTAYRVTFNENLSLLTIRGTTPEIISEHTANRTILLSQTTRRTARYVIQENT